MAVTQTLDMLADASMKMTDSTMVIAKAYQDLSRMRNLLISIEVAIDETYPERKPPKLEMLMPMIREFTNE